MKCKVTIYLFLVLISTNSFAQDMTQRITTRVITMENDTSDGVALEMECSKEVIKIGEDFILTYRIKNGTTETITVIMDFLWRDNGFVFYDLHTETSLPRASKKDIEWTFEPLAIVLNPREAFEAFVPIKTGKGDIELGIFGGYYEKYSGLYFYMDRSEEYILIGNSKEIIIQAEYSTIRFQIKKIAEMNFKNIFVDDLFSTIPIYLEILD
jgi:hypothetical protein